MSEIKITVYDQVVADPQEKIILNAIEQAKQDKIDGERLPLILIPTRWMEMIFTGM
jgi:hypothetical protein